MTLQSRIEEFKQYVYETDWQKMDGPYLVEIDPVKFLEETYHLAKEEGIQEFAKKVEGFIDPHNFQKTIDAAKQEGREAERREIMALFDSLDYQCGDHKRFRTLITSRSNK